MELTVLKAPEKPRFGEPCNGCGYCCAAEVCFFGRKVFGEDVPAPCPGMDFRDGRFWCRLVDWTNEEEGGEWLRMRMGIGVGCDAEDEAEVAARRQQA